MKKLIFLIILLFAISTITVYAEPNNALKAAFIRNDHLWIKNELREQRITEAGYVRFPKWSFDGTWIAYLKGTKQNDSPLYNGDLMLYNLKNNKQLLVHSNVSNNFQWSPNSNAISFLVDKKLFGFDTSAGKSKFISDKVENFSWLPNGNDILTSSKESEELGSDILLSKITFKNSSKPIIKHFFTIPIGAEEFYVSTSVFKWSFDNKWISFILVPTASLSADSNALCILSNDGKSFQKANEMLKYDEWFKWAPSKNLLGYISGVGREATANKELKILDIRNINKEITTPRGYADRDLTWINNQTMFVSRSQESSFGGMDTRPLPRLFKINIETNKQSKYTDPHNTVGDFQPQVYQNKLIWIRTDRTIAHVLASPIDQKAKIQWIKNLTLPSSYYEKWNWDEVFSLYKGR